MLLCKRNNRIVLYDEEWQFGVVSQVRFTNLNLLIPHRTTTPCLESRQSDAPMERPVRQVHRLATPLSLSVPSKLINRTKMMLLSRPWWSGVALCRVQHANLTLPAPTTNVPTAKDQPFLLTSNRRATPLHTCCLSESCNDYVEQLYAGSVCHWWWCARVCMYVLSLSDHMCALQTYLPSLYRHYKGSAALKDWDWPNQWAASTADDNPKQAGLSSGNTKLQKSLPVRFSINQIHADFELKSVV